METKFAFSKFYIQNLFIFKVSLLVIFLISLILACNKEKENFPNQQLKSFDPNQEYATPYNCDSCYSGAVCIVSDNSPCDRIELDPCDHDDMFEYAKAIACELTKQINGCGPKNLPSNCDTLIFKKVCLKDILVSHPILDSLNSGFNPFHYCSYSTSCESHVCTDPITSDPIDELHLPIGVVYQNAMMNYARLIANLYKPTCLTGVQPTIYQIAFKVCKLVEDPPFPCGEGPGFCYDTELRLEITYICCEQDVE